MSNKRGSPVLIEVLKGKPTFPAAQGSGSTSAPGSGSANPAKAPPPPAQPPIATYISEGGESLRLPRMQDIRLTPRTLAIGLGVLIVVFGVVWVIAFRTGQSAEKQQWEGRLPLIQNSDGGLGGSSEPTPLPPDPLNNTRPDPSIPEGSNDPSTTPGGNSGNSTTPAPAPPDGGVPALQDGFNHLVVGTFRRFSDAEASAKYLVANRMTVIITGPRGVDPTTKTSEWWVWIADGFERPLSSPEAARLRARVVELGRLWKLQNKLAPTDFSQPYWAKYRKAAGRE